MPVDISKTNLRSLGASRDFNDLYEVEKSEYDLPYATCLKEPLKLDCEYRGYSFYIQIYPDVPDEQYVSDDMFKESTILSRYESGTVALQVEYYNYTIGCEQGHYEVKTSEKRQRTVKMGEFAAGPYFAMLFATKTYKPTIFIEDVMAQLDPLYSSMDYAEPLRAGPVGAILKKSQIFTLRLFKRRVMQANPSSVQFIAYDMLGAPNTYEGRRHVRSVYLNILHDCDRYCAVSMLGRFHHMPFDRIERDGLRCARDLIEVPHSETYATTHNSRIKGSKGRPHNDKLYNKYEDLYRKYHTYAKEDDIHVLRESGQELYSAMPDLLEARGMKGAHIGHADADDTGYHTTAIVMGCTLPVIVGGAMVAYVMRSNSTLAHGVRNAISSVISTMRGMRRVNTQETIEDCGDVMVKETIEDCGDVMVKEQHE